MFSDHALDLTSPYRLTIQEPSGPHSASPRREPRAWPIGIAVAGTFALAFVSAALASPRPVAGTGDPAGRGPGLDPVPGEFRLAPGNAMPPGIVVPLDMPRALGAPMPGEVRRAPGNLAPAGIVAR